MYLDLRNDYYLFKKLPNDRILFMSQQSFSFSFINHAAPCVFIIIIIICAAFANLN